MYIQLGIPLLESILYQNIELYMEMEIKFEIFFSSVKFAAITRRRFDVHTTSITFKRRRMDVKTTPCAYWDIEPVTDIIA